MKMNSSASVLFVTLILVLDEMAHVMIVSVSIACFFVARMAQGPSQAGIRIKKMSLLKVSWFQSLLVSWCLGFKVYWRLGLLVSRFQSFKVS